MKKIFLTILLCAVFFLSGCGGGIPGGGAGSGASNSAAGGASFATGTFHSRINWPARENGSKFISTSTSRITVSITGEGIPSGSPMTGSVNYGASSIYVNSVPTGSKEATLSALDSSGNILSNRVLSFTQVANQITTVSANLGATITDAAFVPSSMTVPLNTSIEFKNNGTRSYTLSITSPSAVTTAAVLGVGSSYTYSFAALGAYSLYLVEKPSVNMTITCSGDSPTPSSPLAVDTLIPSSGSIGDTVTIYGSGFGATQGTSTVTFNGTAATVNSWNPYSIVCKAPSGSSTGNVVVTVSGAASTGVTFTILGSWTPDIL